MHPVTRWVFWMWLACGAAAQADPAPPPTGAPESRERLHHCAAQWVKLKRTGEAGGKLWRDFWEVCGKK